MKNKEIELINRIIDMQGQKCYMGEQVRAYQEQNDKLQQQVWKLQETNKELNRMYEELKNRQRTDEEITKASENTDFFNMPVL